MDRLGAMAMFVAVAEAGSLAGAGQSLGLSPPAVTRSLKALEERLGTRLVHRTTRALRLTQAGERYLEDCRRILQEVEEAEEEARGVQGAAQGTLFLTAPVLFGQLLVLPLLREFLDSHPLVKARVLLVDRVVSLVEEGLDLGVRIADLPDSSLYAVRVGEVRRVVCAAPSYLERAGLPDSPSDLRDHRLISTDDGKAWRFQTGTIPVDATLLVNSNQAAVDAAVDGWGIARLLSYQVAGLVREGKLRILLAPHETPAWPVHLVYQEGRKMPKRLRLLLDALTQGLRNHPACDSAL